jgi:hypothetical protein
MLVRDIEYTMSRVTMGWGECNLALPLGGLEYNFNVAMCTVCSAVLRAVSLQAGVSKRLSLQIALSMLTVKPFLVLWPGEVSSTAAKS